MNENEKLISSLQKFVKTFPDVEVGKLLRYLCSIDNMAYMSDAEVTALVESYYRTRINSTMDIWEIKPTEDNCVFGCLSSRNYYRMIISKELEEMGYARFKEKEEGKIYIPLTEIVGQEDFLSRFTKDYPYEDCFSGYTIINHCDWFQNDFGNIPKYFYGFCIFKTNGNYTMDYRCLSKYPDFAELLAEATTSLVDDVIDEVFCMVFNRDAVTLKNYASHVAYGVFTRPKAKEIEIFPPYKTVEIFHDFMQRVKVTSDARNVFDWEGGVIE